MRQLIVLRHGKAEDHSPDGDFGRRLTGRGERDAASAGKKIRGIVTGPAGIVTSDAVRALATARIAAREMGTDTPVVPDRRIYNASLDDLRAVIQDLDDRTQSVVVVGHNPGLEELVRTLCPETAYDFSLSPAAFSALDLDAASWRDVGSAAARLAHVFHP